MSVRRVIVSTIKAPSALGPYSQGVVVDSTMYVSGQIGMKPGTTELVAGGVTEQARQALNNMGEILRAAGASYNNVVKTTVLLADMDDFEFVSGVGDDASFTDNVMAPLVPFLALHRFVAGPILTHCSATAFDIGWGCVFRCVQVNRSHFT